MELNAQNLIEYSGKDTIWVGKSIEFQSLVPDENISIYYSFDNGRSWQLISESNSKTINWEVPFTLSKKVIFKAIKKDTISFELLWDKKNAHSDEIRSIDFSPDGKFVLTYSLDGWLKVWDIANRIGVDSLVISGEEYLYDAKFYKSADKILYSVGDFIWMWDRTTKTSKFFTSNFFDSFVRKIDVNPVKNEFCYITDDMNINAFQNENISPFFWYPYFKNDYGNAYEVRYSNDGKFVGIATYNGKIIINDLDKFNANYKVDSKPIYSLCFLNDNNNLAFGGSTMKLQFFDRVNRTYDTLVPSFNSSVRDIKYSQTRNEVYASSTDSTLKIWNVQSKHKFPLELKEPYQILTMDLTKSSDTIATSGRKNDFRIWKNYQITEQVQLDTFVSLQEIFFKISSDNYNPQPNEEINTFVEISAKYQDTLRKLDLWKVHTEIKLPIASLFNNEFEKSIDSNYYSFSVDSNFVFKPDYYWRNSFKSLYANQKNESFQIDTVVITPEDNFYPIILTDSIKVDYFCENPGNIQFVEIPKLSNVISSGNLLQCIFDKDIDKYTEILVFDYSGKVYSNTFYYFANSKELIFKNINSNLIFIIIKNKNYTISLKLINIR